MTNQILESAGTASTQGVPTPAGGVVSGQPPSTGVVTFTAEQIAALEPMIEKRVQSMKDRRIAELENAVNELRSGLPVQASTQPAPPSQAQAPSLANGVTQAAQPAAIDYLAPLKAVGLDANDSEVLGLMVKHNGDQTAFNAALVDLKARRLNQPPAPASAIPPSQGMGTNGKIDLSSIKDPAKLYEMARETGTKLPGRAG